MQCAFGAIALLIFVSAITPGPNNLIVLGKATAQGAKAAAPAVLGIVAGGMAMIALAQLGLAALVFDHARLFAVVLFAGCAYLAWLGISMIVHARAAADATLPTTTKAAGALGLFAFQFANPKAWVLVLTAASAASAAHVAASTLIALFAAISLASLWTWALLGQAMQRWKRHSPVRVWFERSMGALLLASTLVLAAGY